MEESGFKVYKDFKTSQRIIDIYAVLSTIMGDFTMVVACKNYDKQWEVGLDIVKEMEMIGKSLKASKVVIATSSKFSPKSRSYASEKNINLLDREDLIILAKKFSKENGKLYEDPNSYNNDENDQELENIYDKPDYTGQNSNNYDEPYYTDQNSNNYDETYTEVYKLGKNDKSRSEYDSKASYSSRYNSKQNKNKSKHLNSSKKISPGVKKTSRLQTFKAKNSKNSNFKSNSGILNKRKIEEPQEPLSSKIKVIFNNTIVLIVLVVAITYLISLIINKVANVPIGIQGLVKIISSLVLSYGLVFVLNHKGTAVLLRGTIVFFVSLIISILMIIFL